MVHDDWMVIVAKKLTLAVCKYFFPYVCWKLLYWKLFWFSEWSFLMCLLHLLQNKMKCQRGIETQAFHYFLVPWKTVLLYHKLSWFAQGITPSNYFISRLVNDSLILNVFNKDLRIQVTKQKRERSVPFHPWELTNWLIHFQELSSSKRD